MARRGKKKREGGEKKETTIIGRRRRSTASQCQAHGWDTDEPQKDRDGGIPYRFYNGAWHVEKKSARAPEKISGSRSFSRIYGAGKLVMAPVSGHVNMLEFRLLPPDSGKA
ncbi:predicted protein [Histoplasma capsulatum H143]|uniref:Uncharacterized protein n=1 Tax=Ajellomyces capsulatus (strain H143) TaxID=544712 RepID=C6H672_AJECH|nr:predicted protein [Histoplasma capsulatum H143]